MPPVILAVTTAIGELAVTGAGVALIGAAVAVAPEIMTLAFPVTKAEWIILIAGPAARDLELAQNEK